MLLTFDLDLDLKYFFAIFPAIAHITSASFVKIHLNLRVRGEEEHFPKIENRDLLGLTL